jgi:hypothetical protein
MKPSILLAAGCSWVAAKSIDCDPDSIDMDFAHIEDPAFVKQHSFAGLLTKQLGFDQLEILAEHGANNEQQLKRIINFVENNKDNYSDIFVLWGLTSIYRWQMYNATSNQVENCMIGRKQLSGVEQEIKSYFSKHWNKDLELERLGSNVLMLHGYLDNYNIKHLFFNSFQSYTDSSMNYSIDDNYFYKVKEDNNDMLSLLCAQAGVENNSKSPWLNLLAPVALQYNTGAVKKLQTTGWLDKATAHPTVKAHVTIAKELHKYIEG